MRTLYESILDKDFDTKEAVPSLNTPLARNIGQLLTSMSIKLNHSQFGDDYSYDDKEFIRKMESLFEKHGKKISKSTARKRKMFIMFDDDNMRPTERTLAFTIWVEVDEDTWRSFDACQDPYLVIVRPSVRLRMSSTYRDATYYELPKDVLNLFDFIFK